MKKLIQMRIVVISLLLAISGCFSSKIEIQEVENVYNDNTGLISESVKEIIQAKIDLNAYFEQKLTDGSFILSEAIIKDESFVKKDLFLKTSLLFKKISNLEIQVKYDKNILLRVIKNSNSFNRKEGVLCYKYSMDDTYINSLENRYSKIIDRKTINEEWDILIIASSSDL